MGGPALRLHLQTPFVSTKSQTALSSCLLPYIPLSTQPYPSCLYLPSVGIKGEGYPVIGSPLCELFFSPLDRFSLRAQGGVVLTEIPLPLSLESWD